MATIVLAAGESRRFGSAKQLAPVEGRPMVLRVLDAMEGFGDPEIVVVGADADLVAAEVPAGWVVALARDWRSGPGASLRAGLAAAPDAEAALIVLADLPWLQREAVDRVRAAAVGAPDRAAFRAFDGDTPGHPLLVRGTVLEAARTAPDSGLRGVLSRYGFDRIDCSGLGVASDVDTIADLRPG